MNETTDNNVAQSPKTPQLDKIGKETLVALLSHRTRTATALSLGIDRRTLFDRIKKYGLDELIETIPEQALQTLRIGSDLAAEELCNELDHRSVEVRQKAAESILDRVGLVAKDKRTDSLEMKDGDRSITFKITRGE